ncbi:MAG TPA: D-alanyl-D-alanine carboxypeptidase family protein [Burkholderiales bacterium]|nr:D-alanyl-D-alanine carboxypeptidase family protein [Burkholderiales bacterium]
MIRIFFLILALFVQNCFAVDLPVTPPPQLNAKAWLLVDLQSGQTLAEHDADRRMEPASLTKLMTTYLAFAALKQGRLKLTDIVPVSTKAWKTEGSRMFIEPNKPVTVNELLHGMIIQSGNDATVALAEDIGGSEAGFVDMMNNEARQLGMTHTHFVTATGLPDPQHYTTARDLSLVASAIFRDFPEYAPLFAIKEYRYNNITQANRNRLLWSDPSVDGMKTGHTESAGYCLIASAHRGDRRLLAIVLGTSSDYLRASETQRLLNYGFQSFDGVRLYAADQPVAQLKVWKGKYNTVKAGFIHPVYLSVPRGRSADLKTTLTTRQPLMAPLFRGQVIGTLTVSLDNRVLEQLPLQALENVSVASALGRAWDSLMLKFK